MSLVTNRSSGSAVALDEPPDNGLSKKLARLSLNPDAQEFVPSSSRTSVSAGNSGSNGAASEARSKANVDSSSNPNASDDEFRQFWRSQLPDDLITDSDFSSEIYSPTNQYDQQQARDFDVNFGGRTGGPRRSERTNGSYSQDEKSAHSWPANGSTDGLELEQSPDEIHPLTLLATEFPNFGVQSLSDIYSATGCDLSLTIEMLTQLELQEEGAPSRRTSRPAAVPSLTPTDFPSLPGVEIINGLSGHQETRPMSSQRPMELATSLRRFGPGEQGIDFAAVVRKQAQQAVHQQPSHWPFERSAGDITIGPGRSSAAQSLGVYGFNSRPPQQPWLETGEAVASMYSDMREEARDHARVRNAYFEQARQAYLVGNKALAKELSAKGQWHNEQMKNAHGKAAEAIFHQRNASLLHLARDGNRMIDLHGLHVGEAIPLLRRELSALRIASRVTSKRQCVYVCVGTGHHTKGSRTPARVPIAIERYLAEDERLQFSEVQPGMLRVFVQ
ncbi:hypothetical protein SELMODRAFT_438708 [Selaginella moellendorffii]|uniref:Smr domain-containing protein n=1 Tax=Selaginella moellendorffii TaxID=88036 RepID=D8QYX3_SELML|nr:polyadenylate-binding protein-interacting protein 7 isoform X1 [Selaginella moellendorffii]XP_024524606.1 polyadenylate-binding protein-interacting protein 7 isoform X1 [Selaginella moellendorffii]EFJ34315.1 hypothetical protein SELMODRAFT_438708 [Selaginella moellendorffii]|eukprot:XP_002963982.1 polyadenylate-binding protein-interacting protein 7 isoform X1 [Selaginella moellendorffii]